MVDSTDKIIFHNIKSFLYQISSTCHKLFFFEIICLLCHSQYLIRTNQTTMTEINNTDNIMFDSDTMTLNFVIEHTNATPFKSNFDFNTEQWGILVQMIEYRMKHGIDHCSVIWNELLGRIICSKTIKKNMRLCARNKQMTVEYSENDNIPCIMWIKKNGTRRIIVPVFYIEYILDAYHPRYSYSKHESATGIFLKVSHLVILYWLFKTKKYLF